MKYKHIKKIYDLVTLLLALFWLFSVFNYLKSEDFTLTTLDGRYDSGNLEFSRVYEMHKDNFITGTFKSKYPNLGTTSVRFNTHNRINDDVLRFRLKDVESNNWYYEADYNTDQFQNGKLFPFGFPLIENSQNKSYFFEIVSLNGTKNNAVSLDGDFPPFVSRHVFTKEDLLNNPTKLIYFIFHKITSIVGDKGILIHSLVYFMPVFYFLAFRWFGFSSMIPVTLVFISILADLLLIKTTDSFLPLAIAFAWSLPVFKFRIHQRVSATCGLVFLSLVPLALVVKDVLYAEKFAIWAIIFFSISTLRQVHEFYFKSKHQVYPKSFWHNLYLDWRNTAKFIYLVANGQIVITAAEVAASPKAQKVITLIIYRLGTPMAKTYFATTYLVARLVITLVVLLKFTYRYGPYILFAWLLWLNIYKVSGYLHFYQSFYPDNQDQLFWQGTGVYLLPIFSIILIVFLIIQRNRNWREKAIFGCLLLLIGYKASVFAFNSTTNYKYEIFIWSSIPKRATLWDEVKVIGRNFREMPFKGKVYINGVEHMVLSWKDREIVFQADPTKTKTGEVKIFDYYGKESSNTIHLEYYDLQTGELIK